MGEIATLTPLRPKALEFFAGIGLARIGLERAGFHVAWSNDYEADKEAMFHTHFSDLDQHEFVLGDIREVQSADLPQDCAIAWASSPCTDLSLAGSRAGLDGEQSGTFWQFIRLLKELGDARPELAVLENVVGLATSNGGDDITAAISAFNELGYSVDVLTIDARRFVPQSRPRLFVVAAQNPPLDVPEANPELRPDWLQWVFSDPGLLTHRAQLPSPPDLLTDGLSSIVEEIPNEDSRWWDVNRTAAFVKSLSPTQLDRVKTLQVQSGVQYRTAYRRTRNGVPVWEVRPDDIAGCLRTARGGSSKQAVVQLGNGTLRVRWLTPLEYAALMGIPEYNLTGLRTNQALFGFGDAVAVPVVEWLSKNYLMPLSRGHMASASPTSKVVANG